MRQKTARFRDMRPPRIDTNLYSYHLTKLIKNRMVQKQDDAYTLIDDGLFYADRHEVEELFERRQPWVVVMLVVQNGEGDLLLQRRTKQPFIDTFSLPYAEVHIDDTSLENAARRTALEKLKVVDQDVMHAGSCYIRVKQGEGMLSTTLAHVYTFNRDDIETNSDTVWVRPHKLSQYDLSPCTEEIVARTFFRDPHFFEEFETTW